MYRKAIIVTLVVFLGSNVSALNIGTAPGTQDLGTYERGQTYEVKFYTLSDADDEITLDPLLDDPRQRFFRDRDASPEGFNPDEASRENIDDWINFDQEEYVVDSNNSRLVELANGNQARINGEITFFVEVPQNAEPGYHAGTINVNPQFDEGEGANFRTIGLSTYTFWFKVPGEAEQDVRVVDVEGLRSGDNRARIDVTVRNEGTVTSRIKSSDFDLFTDNGRKIESSSGGNLLVGPGETKSVEVPWVRSDDIQAGNYRIQGEVNYITGQAFLDDTFSINDFIEIESSNNNESGGGIVPSGDQESDNVPTMLIVMFLVLAGSIMYAMNIDPLLIVMAVMLIALSSYIWFANLPVILIGILVLFSAGLFYYGWI